MKKLWNFCTLGKYSQPDRKLTAFQDQGTVLLSALYGYDAMAPDATPWELFRFLKKNVEAQKKAINQYSGHISRYAGDAFRAFWTGQDQEPTTASAAFSASCHILKEYLNLKNLYPKFNFQLTVSLASGPLSGEICGTMREFDLTGPPVDLTDRLHNFRSSHRPRVIMEENTVSLLGENRENLIEIGEITDKNNRILKVYYWTTL